MKTSTPILFHLLLRDINPGLVCDAGAMNGQCARNFRRDLPDADIIAFEANPRNIMRMLSDDRLLDCDIAVESRAVWNQDGPLKFNVEELSVKPDQEWREGASSVHARKSDSIGRTEIDVDGVRLDTFISALDPIPQTIALWVDVTGAAFEVLEGIESVRHSVMLVNVNTEKEGLWHDQRTQQDVESLMLRYGFVIIGSDSTDRNQSNLVFINKELLESAPSRFKKIVRRASLLSWLQQSNRGIFRGLVRRWLGNRYEFLCGQVLRVLHVTYSSTFGNAEMHILSLARHLDKTEFQVDIACPEGPTTDTFRDALETYAHIGIKTLPQNTFGLTAVWQLYRLIAYAGYHIVHIHESDQDSTAGRYAAKLVGFPKIVIHRTGVTTMPHDNASMPAPKPKEKILKLLFGNHITHSVITRSNAAKETIITTEDLEDKDIFVIPYGLALSEFDHSESSRLEIKKELGFTSRNAIITNMDDMLEKSDLEMLLGALTLVLNDKSNARLLLSRDRSSTKEIEQHIVNLEMDKVVQFAGQYASRADILKATSVYVSLSSSEETTIGVLEAMAAGVPVVACRHGGIPEIIKDKKNGLTVKPSDQEKLAAGILSLLSDKDLVKQIVSVARETVKNDFRVDTMTRKTSALYCELLKHAG